MKLKSMVKRILAMLMAIAMFLAYTPVLSYALTEYAEGGDAVAEDAAEDIAAPEAETEDIAAPEAETEDIAAPEAETEDVAAPEAETEESDELTQDPETSAPEEAPAADVQADSVTVEELLSGLEPSEGEADLLELEGSESKAALTDAENTRVIKAEDLRYFGSLRYDTAIKVAERYKEISGSKFRNVIVADGRNFPDALSGGYLAKVKNAPILLVEPSVEKRIADYISENIASGGKVYILGGTGAVSSSFEKKIENKKLTAVRLGGKTRYDTNLKILKAAGVKAEDILVCTGNGYADSLSASAVGKPILLVGDKLTDAQKKYIKGLSTKQSYLIGGTGAVKSTVENDLKGLGLSTQRLWGQTRYETSTKVAKKFFSKTKTVMLVYALNFPDGLSGGPLAMLEDAPIVLTDSSNITAAREYVESSGAFRSITLGGTSLISVEAVRKIMGRKAPFIKADKKYANIQVGERAEITITSNYGTKYTVKNSKFIEVVSKKTTYDEKNGEPIEKYTIKGTKAGTAVLVLTDKYSGLVTKSVPIIVVDGEASIETLYGIIDTMGYINQYEYDKNREDGEKTLELSINANKTVFFVNHVDNVELICVIEDGDTTTFTAMKIPRKSHDIYPAWILRDTESTEKADIFGTDIHPDQYTKSTNLNIRSISENYIENVHPGFKALKRKDYIIRNTGSEKDISFVTSTFKDSMAAWNSALKNNYGMNMNELGFTKY